MLFLLSGKTMGDRVVSVSPSLILPLLEHLKSKGQFDFLMNVSAVDYPKKRKKI